MRTTNESMNSIGGWYGVPGHDANPCFRAPHADSFELRVTWELEGAMRLAERIVLHYDFEAVAPSHLALAIALAPGRGSPVLGSGVASSAEVVTVLSETLFDTTFVGIERVLAETTISGVPDRAEPAAAPRSAQEAMPLR